MRDCGLLCALLNSPDVDTLIGHPLAVHSWKVLMVEQICVVAPKCADISFHRTTADAGLGVAVDIGGREVGLRSSCQVRQK